MELNEQDTAIAKLKSDMDISLATAEFIHGNGIPYNAKDFPDGTPFEDLVNIKMKTEDRDRDTAELYVKFQLGLVKRQHVDVTTIVYV